jgi:hypothetical protein
MGRGLPWRFCFLRGCNMSNSKVSLENVIPLMDEFYMFVNKVDRIMKNTLGKDGDDDTMFCILSDVIESSKKNPKGYLGENSSRM